MKRDTDIDIYPIKDMHIYIPSLMISIEILPRIKCVRVPLRMLMIIIINNYHGDNYRELEQSVTTNYNRDFVIIRRILIQAYIILRTQMII